MKNKQKYEQNEAGIMEYAAYLSSYKKQINYIFNTILPFEMQYCSWTTLDNKLALIARELPAYAIPKGHGIDSSLHQAYSAIVYYKGNANSLRESHNSAYIKSEKTRLAPYFDTLFDHPLDAQQVDAIVSNDDNILVIAGAGCGKTTTVLGRVKYLLHKKLAKPKEILVLSFAKKNVDDLKEKGGYLGIDCRTFHALGYHILKSSGKEPQVIAPNDADALIVEVHQQLIRNQNYLASFNDFVLNGLRPIKNENDFESYADYIQFLKDSDFESIKDMLNKRRHFANKQSKGTMSVIKNGEHGYIANFLFLHGLSYSYQASYPYLENVKQSGTCAKYKNNYKPTFSIYINGYNEDSIRSCPNPKEHIIFLDHHSLPSADGNPRFFESQNIGCDYKQLENWKQNLHIANRTKSMQSYSFEFREKTLEENLIAQFQEYGIRLVRKSNNEVYRLLEEAYGREIDAVLKLVNTFINLFKSNGTSFKEIVKRNKDSFKADIELVDRNIDLLNIVKQIHRGYEKGLRDSNKLDFNDLINQSTIAIAKGSYQHSYKYIIVDEFQDISTNRYSLLQALKRQSYCGLFAVGDDWQSIYRFSGSDLTLFKKFEDYFGYTLIKKIEMTYRFSNPLLGISSGFILKNPNQIQKTLRSGKKQKTKVFFDYSKKNGVAVNKTLLQILQKLFQEYGEGILNKKIGILGRYQHDIRQFEPTASITVETKKSYLLVHTILRDIQVDGHGNTVRNNQLQLNKRIDFYTVHSSKGLEFDVVILVNCETGKYGFPAELSDDSILKLLLTGEDDYANDEERRAFYVAMTRTKERIYFLVDKNRQSKFLRELYTDYVGTSLSQAHCPHCDGELRFIKDILGRTGVSKMFGCVNFRYGCDYTTFKQECVDNLKELS
ncbi:UvrD-helicase domain-containing protein [Sphingobacterium tabacisoli]|uniref:DNA 3'-5' helicase n=1 Tax=Sphingobacterium tabacisoli TaxID=2044855 RepID=A0ABW5L3W9_9SPHI|nr:UvrD-helicase domain-containing protein [Sphingobacterium tabacisoli]